MMKLLDLDKLTRYHQYIISKIQKPLQNELNKKLPLSGGETISIDDLKTQIISDLSAQVSTLQTQIAELTSRIEALENA